MTRIEPIKSKRNIKELKYWLLRQSIRNETFFTLGVNTGLRVSDLLALKFYDLIEIKNKKIFIKRRIKIVEIKTKKVKELYINDTTFKSIKNYLKTIKHYNLDDPFFFSRNKVSGKLKPISRQRAYAILARAGEDIGIQQRVGTHSLRKTFAYCQYENGVSMAMLAELLNHSSELVTRKYLGLDQEEKDNAYKNCEI